MFQMQFKHFKHQFYILDNASVIYLFEHMVILSIHMYMYYLTVWGNNLQIPTVTRMNAYCTVVVLMPSCFLNSAKRLQKWFSIQLLG